MKLISKPVGYWIIKETFLTEGMFSNFSLSTNGMTFHIRKHSGSKMVEVLGMKTIKCLMLPTVQLKITEKRDI